MKLYICNKIIGYGQSSVIDEKGAPVFDVEAKFFSITDKKFVCDLQGNKLYTIRNKFWKLFVKIHLFLTIFIKKYGQIVPAKNTTKKYLIICESGAPSPTNPKNGFSPSFIARSIRVPNTILKI